MKTVVFLLISSFFTFAKAQEKSKDTLFFKYDAKYIITYVEIPNHFYLKDSSGANNGNFYFTASPNNEIENTKNIKSKEVCLKRFIRSSKFYDKNKKPQLNDYALWEYLNNYTIILVKKNSSKKSYIEVKPSFEIE